MARTYKQPSLVSGMSIKDIINMDINKFNSLNEKDMRKVVGRLVSAGNKRLRSFEKAGESSPATRHVMRSGGVFSTKGKNLQQLRSEYMRAKNFIESETGTRKGWTKVKKKTIEGLKKQGVEMSNEQWDDVWKAYEELKEKDKEVSNKALKYTTLQDVVAMVKQGDMAPDEIALALHDRLSEIYEENEVLDNEFNGVSGFFDNGQNI